MAALVLEYDLGLAEGEKVGVNWMHKGMLTLLA